MKQYLGRLLACLFCIACSWPVQGIAQNNLQNSKYYSTHQGANHSVLRDKNQMDVIKNDAKAKVDGMRLEEKAEKKAKEKTTTEERERIKRQQETAVMSKWVMVSDQCEKCHVSDNKKICGRCKDDTMYDYKHKFYKEGKHFVAEYVYKCKICEHTSTWKAYD